MVGVKRSAEAIRNETFIKKHQKEIKNPLDPKTGVSNCIVAVPVSMYLSLAPIYSQKPLEGIAKQHLNPMMMKYNNNVDGVVLGFEKVRIEDASPSELEGGAQKLVKVTPDTPFAFLWCSAKLYVWRPQVGDVVEGWIFIQSPSHIGLLIHDAFNASIRTNNMPTEWTFISNEEENETTSDSETAKNRSMGHWVDENGQHVNGKLRFTVRNIYKSGRVVSVEGTLLTDGTSQARTPAENLPVVSNKKIIFDDEVSTENRESHKDLSLSKRVTEDNGEEIMYEKNSSDTSSSDSD
ncbi:LAMI_0F05996g1_1 [Lachancea mirantina]|uniref:DNA-directed RNA polymerase subunit n=1 Tax=Lachancea mirantina TaxID=1230905 RepID=A0A1G4JYK9_9SACH|nr:LAMI_0F05996g1_1 [Lachancea mirantina]